MEFGRTKLLLDCGSGVLHGLARDGQDWQAISHVAISHFHTDHFGDLPALLWAWIHGVTEKDQRPRTLIGPQGMGRVLEALAEAYGDYVLEPGSPLEVLELGPGESWEDLSGDFVLRTHETIHTEESLAFRVEVGEGAVGYTGDTGPHRLLGPFFRGSNVLITECSVPDHAAVGNHLTPTQVAQLATEAQAATLVVTHVYPALGREGLAERIRSQGYRGTIEIADDGLVLEV